MMRKMMVLVGVVWGIAAVVIADEIHVPGDYLTIQEAVNAAQFGDSILIAPGEYEGIRVYDSPNNISLIGSGAFSVNPTIITSIAGSDSSICMLLDNIFGWSISDCEVVETFVGLPLHWGAIRIYDSENVTIERIHGVPLESGGEAILLERCNNTEIKYSLFTAGSPYVVQLIDGSNLYLRNLTVSGSGHGITIRSLITGDLVIENCISAFNGLEGIRCVEGWQPNYTVQYNDAYGNGGGGNYTGFSPDTTNIALDPTFAGGNGWEAYQLLWGSPCIDSGNPNSPLDPDSTTADMGCIYFNHEPTVIPGGNVSGIWTYFGSPYLIEEEIRVPPDSTLIIETGVDVIFQGHFKFIVNGCLEALGTEQDSILFTASDTSEGWHGIRFVDAQEGSRLEYCEIEYGRAFGGTGQYGGGTYILNSSLTVSNCSYHDCWASSVGGAIHAHDSEINVTNSVFFNNTCNGDGGGGIMSSASIATVINSSFMDNTTPGIGGAIYFESNNSWVSGCYFYRNHAAQGGAINCGTAPDISVDNCIMVENTANNAGGGIYHAAGILSVVNNTIIDNSAASGGGIFTYNGIIKNSIIRNNANEQINSALGQVNYCNIQGGWPSGTGNIDQFPFFVDLINGDFHLQSYEGSYHGGAWLPDPLHSPCIDAGDPSSPFNNEPAPNGGIVNMGAYGNTAEASMSWTPPYDFTVQLTYNSGSPVPAGGGYINFDVFLQNNEISSVNFDVWIEIPPVILPPYLPNRSLIFPGGFSITRPDMDWPIPASWPAGNYIMVWNIGDMSTWTSWATDSFPFEKSASDDGSGFVLWEVEGDPLDQLFECIELGETPVVSEFALHQAYPNPFNPTTTISFALPEISHVQISIFNLQGQKVDELVNGIRIAGYHEVTFDGSGLPSGIYFYRIQAGEFSAVQKMVLVK